MIRFVDVTNAYYGHSEDNPCPYGKLCLFINTVSDSVVSNRWGGCIFGDKEGVISLGDRYWGRVPKGFFQKEYK